MAYQNLYQKYEIISELLEIAKADNEINIPELTYITWVGKKLGITPSEINKLFKSPRESHRPMSPEQRKEHLQRLIKMIKVDGVVDDEEIVVFRKICAKMYINEGEVDRMIAELC